jgi:hypothetical protein
MSQSPWFLDRCHLPRDCRFSAINWRMLSGELSSGFVLAQGGGVECHAAASNTVLKYCIASSNTENSLMRKRRLMCSLM